MYVYILPLRNENNQAGVYPLNHKYGLYPTFKEWKQNTGIKAKAKIEYVYILPLRNENNKATLKPVH